MNPSLSAARHLPFVAIAVVALSVALAARAERMNGFELTGALVPLGEIHRGGPPKDGIPAIDNPRFVAAGAATFLKGESQVLGIHIHGQAKAYPVSILNWHEVVNDRIGPDGVAITFCPLCGTGMAFRAGTSSKPGLFGVSGLLYNSDVLLYDRESSSLWSQLLAKAVAGPRKGDTLEALPVSHTTWGDWRRRHPATVVLSPDTGFERDYASDPYQAYVRSERLMFPVSATSRSFHPKERVIGVSVGGSHKAYPFVELDATPAPLLDRVGTAFVKVEFDAESRSGRVLDSTGREIHSVTAYWFAWFAFHPDTQIHRAPHPAPSNVTPGVPK